MKTDVVESFKSISVYYGKFYSKNVTIVVPIYPVLLARFQLPIVDQFENGKFPQPSISPTPDPQPLTSSWFPEPASPAAGGPSDVPSEE